MGSNTAGDNIAVLIDAENVSYRDMAAVLRHVATYGRASVRRVYGDFTNPQLRPWKDCSLKHSLIPMQQFAHVSGKNACDIAMVIDAMDLLHTGRFSGFCIVSSDSDFTRLAARIREQGVSVYGFGDRNTSQTLIASCSQFIYFDSLSVPHDEATSVPEATSLTLSDLTIGSCISPDSSDASSSARVVPTGPRMTAHSFQSRQNPILPRPLDDAVRDSIRLAIGHCNYYEDDYVNLAQVGGILGQLSPGITARNYGYDKLLDFVKASHLVEHKWKQMSNGPPVALVRLKDNMVEQGLVPLTRNSVAGDFGSAS